MKTTPHLALSDRLNAVLVRDVQQMLNGRAFVAVLVLALLTVAVLAAFVAGAPEQEDGRDAFQMVMVALAPVLTLIVPMQAFFSARQEVGGGASELLLLSSLTPARIVRGKLLSSAVQIVLWTSLFAPVVAFTFLLRGISVVEIGAALVLAMLFGLTMSAAGIALGTLTVFRRVAQLVNAVSLLALAGGTFFFTGFLAFGLNEVTSGSSLLFVVLGWILFSTLAALVLLVLVACSQFTHPYENRSTGFRCFFPAVVLASSALVLLLADKGDRGEILVVLSASMLGLAIVFFVFAATEERELSPRVRSQVPAGGLRALLLAPLLPGQGRGLLYALIVAALLLALVQLGLWLDKGRDADVLYACRMLALYGLFYAALGAAIRRRLAAGPGRNWLARLLVLIVFVLGCAVPMVIQVMVGITSWTPLQILNPFWTIADRNDSQGAFVLLGLMTFVLFLLQIGTIVDGLREVAAASRRRRQTALAAPASPAPPEAPPAAA